jgi:uncharacterized membrane protein YhaH (DUF805 family)
LPIAYILSSPSGRITRSEWWAGIAVVAAFGAVVAVVICLALGDTLAARIAILVLEVLLLYPAIAVCSKRFQDRNKPGSLGLIAPLLAIVLTLLWAVGVASPFAPAVIDWILFGILAAVLAWYAVELGGLPGTPGPNAYGADPASAASA